MFHFPFTKGQLSHWVYTGLAFAPDFIIYQIEEMQYRMFWEDLEGHPKHYIYTDGLQVHKVGWFRYAWESVKGWFGFINHCEEKLVDMTLAKIAYVGYIQGYHTKTNWSLPLEHKLISDDFMQRITAARSDENSAILQSLLVGYFNQYSEHFFELDLDESTEHLFGTVLLGEGLVEPLLLADPQAPTVIEHAIAQIQRSSSGRVKTLERSKFNESYADHMVINRNYSEALKWSATVSMRFKSEFISHYFLKKQFDAAITLVSLDEPLLANKVVDLLFLHCNIQQHMKYFDKALALVGSNGDLINKVANLLFEHSNLEKQIHLLKSHPEIRRALAQLYFGKSQQEKNKSTFTKWLSGDNYSDYMAAIVELDPTILDDDKTLSLEQKKELIAFVFKNTLATNQHEEAVALFKRYSYINVPKDKVYGLKKSLESEYDKRYTDISKALEDDAFDEAQRLVEENKILAVHIARLSPQDNKTVHAMVTSIKTQLMSVKQQPDVKDAQYEQLQKGDLLLRKHRQHNPSKFLIDTHNQLLLRMIDHVKTKLWVPATYNNDKTLRNKFKTENQRWLNVLKEKLKTFIELNKSTQINKQLLARMNYTLGDVYFYFDLSSVEAIPYFKAAATLVPENPYYGVRLNELKVTGYEDSWQNIAEEECYPRLYNCWANERWMESQIESIGFDIHNPVIKEKGFLQKLFN